MTSRKVSFTVYRRFFDAIVSGEKVYEFRAGTPRWVQVAKGLPTEAIFLCGPRIHRRHVVGIQVVMHPGLLAEHVRRQMDALGPGVSIGGPLVVFSLGEEVRP